MTFDIYTVGQATNGNATNVNESKYLAVALRIRNFGFNEFG